MILFSLYVSFYLRLEISQMFCFVGRSLNAADDITGITPLQIAVETGNVDCIREMVLCGARLDAVDKKGCTVFHYAARSSNEMIIQVYPTCHKYTVSQKSTPASFFHDFIKFWPILKILSLTHCPKNLQ